jgi:hypothetical protein
MVDVGIVGLVGSPADVATFVALLYLYRDRVADDLHTISVALVALAERNPRVSEDRLADDLEVDQDDLDDVRPVMVEGPPVDGSQND